MQAEANAKERDSGNSNNDVAKQDPKIPNIDALSHNLTKCYYTLRFILTRDYKIKLFNVVNYFRAIQRRLALDMREFMTREKALGDKKDIIDPHFG